MQALSIQCSFTFSTIGFDRDFVLVIDSYINSLHFSIFPSSSSSFMYSNQLWELLDSDLNFIFILTIHSIWWHRLHHFFSCISPPFPNTASFCPPHLNMGDISQQSSNLDLVYYNCLFCILFRYFPEGFY